MTLFHPWILEGLGILLLAVGAAGLVSLFISQPLGRVLKRTVAVVCAVMAIAGGLLMARADALRDTDRDLSPAEQANLARAIGQFPKSGSRCSRPIPTARPGRWPRRWRMP